MGKKKALDGIDNPQLAFINSVAAACRDACHCVQLRVAAILDLSRDFVSGSSLVSTPGKKSVKKPPKGVIYR